MNVEVFNSTLGVELIFHGIMPQLMLHGIYGIGDLRVEPADIIELFDLKGEREDEIYMSRHGDDW